MPHPPIPEPTSLGTITNFAWLRAGVLARGEQPALDGDDFALLKQAGVATVLTLRTHGEVRTAGAGTASIEYSVAAEAAACRTAGLGLRSVACTDYRAMLPEELGQTLEIIRAEADAGRPLFVHCHVGVGRTSLATAAGLIAGGLSGDWAAAVHDRFLRHLDERMRVTDPARRRAEAVRVGRGETWWLLMEVARLLGSEVSGEYATLDEVRAFGLFGPRDATRELEAEYARALTPWRERRGGVAGMPGSASHP